MMEPSDEQLVQAWSGVPDITAKDFFFLDEDAGLPEAGIPEPPDGTRLEFEHHTDVFAAWRDDASSAQSNWPVGDGGYVWVVYPCATPGTWRRMWADFGESLRTAVRLLPHPADLANFEQWPARARERRQEPRLRTYIVKAVRLHAAGRTVYHAHLKAQNTGDAAILLGDKIRGGDLDGVHILSGLHVPVEPGTSAGIVEVDVQWFADPDKEAP